MPTPLSYHTAARGLAGFLKYITGSDGVARGTVVPAMSLVDSDGNAVSSGGGSDAAPNVARRPQGTLAYTKVTLVAATAQTILAANSGNGARFLNWTAAAVYVTNGVAGTPASGAPSDYIPAAASGVPGQWEPPYNPVDGVRAVGASAGDVTVVTW